LIDQYSKDVVNAVVESIKKRNGSVRNPTGLLIHALKHGYNPKTPEQIQKEKLVERSVHYQPT